MHEKLNELIAQISATDIAIMLDDIHHNYSQQAIKNPDEAAPDTNDHLEVLQKLKKLFKD